MSENRYDTARYDVQRVREEDARRQSSGGRRLSEAQKKALKRKGRRRRFFLRFVVWTLFVVIASLALSGVGWLLANDFAAFNKDEMTTTITVTKDDDLNTIADKLKDRGLIEYKWFFKLFGKVTHAEKKIGIGEHELNTRMDYNALINGMRSSSGSLTSETVRILIPEGYTVRQIIALLAKYGVNTEEELLDAAANYDFSYAFITGAKGDAARLEGYLFPDTYEFYVNGNPATALAKMLSNFSKKMDDEMMEKVAASGRSLNEIITIASLIEKETDSHDRENIASVIYNRLSTAGETAYLLQGVGRVLPVDDVDFVAAFVGVPEFLFRGELGLDEGAGAGGNGILLLRPRHRQRPPLLRHLCEVPELRQQQQLRGVSR